MILTLIFSVFFGFVNFCLNLFPTATLNSSISTGLTNFVAYAYQFNTFFPIDTAITLLGYAVGFWTLVFLWDILQWLIHLVRGN